MATMFAVVVGCLYAGAVYLMLRRNLFYLILGLVLLSHGTHLLIFTAATPSRVQPPIFPSGQESLQDPPSDPLAQALILTSIVISFGLAAFALALVFCLHRAMGHDDSDALREVDA